VIKMGSWRLKPVISQKRMAKGAVKGYPEFGNITSDFRFHEHFNRGSLNITGAEELYTTNASGTAAFSQVGSNRFSIATGTTINSVGAARMSGMSILRVASHIDSRTRFTLDIIPHLASPTDNLEFFCGLINTSGDLTALPGSNVRKLGWEVDTAVDDNVHLNSSDGTDESDTDTGVTATTDNRLCRFEVTGENAATISLFPAANDNETPDAIHTVTALGATSSRAFMLYFYAKTLNTTTKIFQIREFSIDLR